MRYPLLIAFCLAGLLAAGCGTTGKDFKSSLVKNVVNHQTTQQDVRNMYGEPLRKGVENGNPIWVYEFDTYRVFGKNTSKDLIFVFDKNGVVQSHQFMSNESSP
ncbi:MAG: outer membrane protein assembly factor BamE [Nitrospinales bacterium]